MKCVVSVKVSRCDLLAAVKVRMRFVGCVAFVSVSTFGMLMPMVIKPKPKTMNIPKKRSNIAYAKTTGVPLGPATTLSMRAVTTRKSVIVSVAPHSYHLKF